MTYWKGLLIAVVFASGFTGTSVPAAVVPPGTRTFEWLPSPEGPRRSPVTLTS